MEKNTEGLDKKTLDKIILILEKQYAIHVELGSYRQANEYKIRLDRYKEMKGEGLSEL